MLVEVFQESPRRLAMIKGKLVSTLRLREGLWGRKASRSESIMVQLNAGMIISCGYYDMQSYDGVAMERRCR
jgi:hypothetical protein